jgi:hypothetical protein
MDSSVTYQYVRNKLSPARVEEYELRLLESPELQDELEEALMLQQALKLDESRSAENKHSETAKRPNRMHWALAASIALMLVSAYFHLTARNESNLLKDQVAALSEPRSEVLFATVKIMRSSSNSVPESIIQLSDQNSTVLLEIELGGRSRTAHALLFSFESENEPGNLTWTGSPDTRGLATVAIYSEQIPLGLVWLVVSSTDGEVLERRLLEFKASE